MSEENKNHRTARDALTFEMLGDIGRLHDSVESLKKVLPGQVADAETRISSLIGLLTKAGEVYKPQIDAYAQAQTEKARAEFAKETQAAQAQFAKVTQAAKAQLDAAIQESLVEVKRTVYRSLDAPMASVQKFHQQTLWRTVAFCLLAGFISSAITLGITRYTFEYDRNQADFRELGKAVTVAWPKLDEKSKAAITKERK